MELNSIILLVLLFVALIMMIFFVVKGFSVVGPLHSILMILLFLSSVTFLLFAGMVHGDRVSGIQRLSRVEVQNEELKEQIEDIKYGDLTAPTNDLANLVPLTAEVGRLNLERGRVWRNSRATSFNNGIATVALGAPAPPAPVIPGTPAPAEPANAGLPLTPEMVVYVFGETASGNITVPSFFLGEYFVTDVQGGNATLRPTINLNQAQLQALNSNQFPTWTIYELMPVDSHVAFATGKPTPDAIFGTMDPDMISQMLGINKELLTKSPSEMTLEESQQAAILRSYVFDGQRAPEGTLPENIWLKIRFLQDHAIEVDSAETRVAVEGGYFDGSGRTVDSRLKRAPDQGTVTIRTGDVLVFVREEADRLIKSGVAELIEPVFVRTLNDYAFSFKQLQLRINKAEQDIETTTREIERTQQIEAIGQAQIREKQAERKRLSDDLAQVTKEAEVARAEIARLEQELATLKQELSGMYTAARIFISS